MKIGIVVFPGSNCDQDTKYIIETFLGQKTVFLWHKTQDLQNCDFVFLPGGFSYGDYLRSGAIARFSPIMTPLMQFANGGGYVMGICNGFQILCEAQLLPGALLRNKDQKFISKNIYLQAQTTNSLLTQNLDTKKAYKMPIAHGEGRFFADEKTLAALTQNDQILFKYCDHATELSAEANPNGATNHIAGLCNETRNVFGMMPHPERATDPATGNTDGLHILKNILN